MTELTWKEWRAIKACVTGGPRSGRDHTLAVIALDRIEPKPRYTVREHSRCLWIADNGEDIALVHPSGIRDAASREKAHIIADALNEKDERDGS